MPIFNTWTRQQNRKQILFSQDNKEMSFHSVARKNKLSIFQIKCKVIQFVIQQILLYYPIQTTTKTFFYYFWEAFLQKAHNSHCITVLCMTINYGITKHRKIVLNFMLQCLPLKNQYLCNINHHFSRIFAVFILLQCGSVTWKIVGVVCHELVCVFDWNIAYILSSS